MQTKQFKPSLSLPICDHMSLTANRRFLALAVASVSALALSGCWADSYDEEYCRENPYAEPCPLGQVDESEQTTTIQIHPVP